MIAFIEGQVLLVENGFAVVKTGGIGYQVYLCKKDLETIAPGVTVSLYIHSHIREDAFELYGFLTPLERHIFLLLISVSGVGPKLALAMLSHLHGRDLVDALVAKDIARLCAVPGIGKKTAERLSLELKDKALKLDCGAMTATASTPSSVRASLEQAIKSLGYSKSQSDKAISSLEQGDFANLALEALIKKTLIHLSGNKA